MPAPWKQVLLPDATLGGVNTVMGGEDTDVVSARGIGDWFAANFEHMSFVHQMPQVINIKVNGDKADATTMVIEYLRDKATSTLMLILANYEDKLARTPQGWKFQRRYFRVKSFSKVAEIK
jgi:hypothetical protein